MYIDGSVLTERVERRPRRFHLKVHDGLEPHKQQCRTAQQRIYAQIGAFAEQNPDKSQAWLDKASDVRRATRPLVAYVDSLSNTKSCARSTGPVKDMIPTIS